jgi:hypothetical protein
MIGDLSFFGLGGRRVVHWPMRKSSRRHVMELLPLSSASVLFACGGKDA